MSKHICERKVRAAQGTPLLKVEAPGNGWQGKKKTTAKEAADLLSSKLQGQPLSKGEKVV